jgi:hypothetical protein
MKAIAASTTASSHRALTSLVVLIAALAWGNLGCAASNRDWKHVGSPGDYPCVQEKLAVSVAAEFWTSDEDLRAAFKKTLGDDTLAVRIVIFNRGTTTVRFSSTQASLCFADGTSIPTMPVSDVCKILQGDESAGAMIIVIATGGYGGVIAAAVANSAAENNWKTQSAAKSCSMTLATLEPAQALTGFLFFRLPDPKRLQANRPSVAELKINRMPREEGEPLEFRIPLPLNTPKEKTQ